MREPKLLENGQWVNIPEEAAKGKGWSLLRLENGCAFIQKEEASYLLDQDGVVLWSEVPETTPEDSPFTPEIDAAGSSGDLTLHPGVKNEIWKTPAERGEVDEPVWDSLELKVRRAQERVRREAESLPREVTNEMYFIRHLGLKLFEQATVEERSALGAATGVSHELWEVLQRLDYGLGEEPLTDGNKPLLEELAGDVAGLVHQAVRHYRKANPLLGFQVSDFVANKVSKVLDRTFWDGAEW